MGATVGTAVAVVGAGAAVAAVAGSVGGLLKGILPVELNTYKIPMPNVLSGFASSNYILSLRCLDDFSYNNPDLSYIKGINIPPLILSSAAISPNNRFTIGSTKFEFYMNELSINAALGFTQETKNSQILTLEFSVTEPYSMGGFITVCQAAARQAGYLNYNEAPFLLTIQFRGNTETGMMQNISSVTKFIPFQISTITMKATAKGAVYNVKGYSANAEANKDAYVQAKEEINISGETVQEVLQGGPNGKSLQSVLNQRFIDQAKNNTVKVPDQIYIVFPKDTSSGGSAGASSGSAVVSVSNSVDDPTVLKKLGLTKSTNSVGSNILIQQDDVSDIGLASVGFSGGRRPGQATRPFPDQKQCWDDKTKQWVKGSVVSNPKMTEYQFAQNANVIDVINKVMLSSDYNVKALDPDAVTDTGLRPWWRIDTQVYHVDSNENMQSTGRRPKIIVYRVVPYGVSVAKSAAPNTGTPGTEKLALKVPKVYEYIYTGKNTEVLDFNIEIKNSFVNKFSADNTYNTKSQKLKNQEGSVSTANKEATQPKLVAPNQGGASQVIGANNQPTSSQFSDTSNKGGPGGTRGETEIQKAGSIFHESLMEVYDMQNCDLKITGDPFWISNSGLGNYTAQTDSLNVTSDGDLNWQNSEVHCLINFKSPSDIDQNTGLYDFKNAITANQFSGLYNIKKCVSSFNNGNFTQILSGYRVPNQDKDGQQGPGKQLTSAQKTKDQIKADMAANEKEVAQQNQPLED
jgi:hypothetical protein